MSSAYRCYNYYISRISFAIHLIGYQNIQKQRYISSSGDAKDHHIPLKCHRIAMQLRCEIYISVIDTMCNIINRNIPSTTSSDSCLTTIDIRNIDIRPATCVAPHRQTTQNSKEYNIGAYQSSSTKDTCVFRY